MPKYNKLIQELKSRELSKYRLAMECHIPPSILYSALNGKMILWPKYKKAISAYLSISEAVLFGEEEHE